MYQIEQIPAELTWAIRHEVMYPEKELKDIKLADDEDGIHFGLFDHNQLISIVSWFKRGNNAQFRKLATVKQYQGFGYATLLMEHIIEFSKSERADMLWCNSRKNVSDFYKKLGFKLTENTFNQDGYDFVIMELSLQ
ncbi:GNAT family N-acetyltransferase [Daejeonella oryzae]|uniref:GNAT family N-acetyltransferase n=1 Tax=Daejeonella oryzae TaxID=1122943 RepID=UPI001FE14C7B|nr:GNAT family N-acetyltransferase [Daejeonella oryzae]